MNKVLLRWIGCVAAGLLCLGCADKSRHGKFSDEQMQQIKWAKRDDLPEPTGNTMVIGVFSETISSDEIIGIAEGDLKQLAAKLPESAFNEKARPVIQTAIRGKITDILLYQEARKNAPENIDAMLEKGVEAEVNRFVTFYGNNYALAESKFRERGMGTDWKSFREYQKKRLMIMSYISSQADDEKRFSNPQLMDYYTKHKENEFCWDDLLIFRIINIDPEKLTVEQIQEDPAVEKAAERIADEVMKQLDQGADFAQLAQQYHGDMAPGGGKVDIFHPGTHELPDPYDTLESHAVALEPGQVKGPIVIDGQYFILKLEVYDDSLKFRIINIDPEQLTAEQIHESQVVEKAAERIADEVMKQLNEGADFAQLAQQYHGDPKMVSGGGKVIIFSPSDPNQPDPYDTLISHAVNLEPGQIKGPIVIGGQYFILKLEVYQVADCAPFSQAKPVIEQLLLYELSQKKKMEMVEDLDSRAKFSQMDRFTDFCVKQAYRRWGWQ